MARETFGAALPREGPPSWRQQNAIFTNALGFLPHRIKFGPELLHSNQRLLACSSFSDANEQKNTISVSSFDGLGFQSVVDIAVCYPQNGLAWLGDRLVSCGSSVKIYSFGNGTHPEEATLEHPANPSDFCTPVTAVDVSVGETTNPTIASCDIYGHAVIWDPESKRKVQAWRLDTELYDVAFEASSGSQLALAAGGEVFLTDLRTPGSAVHSLPSPDPGIMQCPARVKWAQNFFACAWNGPDREGGLYIYDARNLRAGPCLAAGVLDIDWSPNPQPEICSVTERGICCTTRLSPDTGAPDPQPALWALDQGCTAVSCADIGGLGSVACVGCLDDCIYVAPLS